ncbi:MAG: YvrJ family protein [Acidobacteriota bacterium]
MEDKPNTNTEEYGQCLTIPEKIRSFVYLIGMVGFPVVIAVYVLVVLNTELKQLDKSISSLSTRITERPMGIDRSIDFVVYVTESLRTDLQAGLYDQCERMCFTVSTTDTESLSRVTTLMRRDLNAYIRPIVRKHQRFAERFPTVGGNLGSFFSLTAPAEDISAGATEAHLKGQSNKDFAEALSAIILNNLSDFGNVEIFRDTPDVHDTDNIVATEARQPNSDNQKYTLIEKDIFRKLALNAIDTATTVLRDKMLEKLKMNATSGQN